MCKIKVIFLGTPEIAVKSLDYLLNQNDIEVQAVVTQPDKPAGRGHKLTSSPIKLLAQQNNIKFLQPSKIRNDEKVLEILKNLKPDIFITFAFGQILSQEVLDIPKYGTINLHASLLPNYRGANPIQWPIINGDKFTGISAMITVLELDAGPVLLTEKIDIAENMNSSELSDVISEKSPKLIYKSIIGLINGEIKPTPQDDSMATVARKIKKEDGKINWTKSSVEIHNLIRGTHPWPLAYCSFNDIIIKIIESRIDYEDEKTYNNIGEIVEISKIGLKVATGKGSLFVTKLQPQGKSVMDAKSWANGARIQIGNKFS
ncbi:MAG: methionyl-tRNA formyltransferase [Candidatus Gastranaerophilales bacterium]|nr:methionyl-tRNA formyltransferase [Candidatus Gastranaerophilales bacterium]